MMSSHGRAAKRRKEWVARSMKAWRGPSKDVTMKEEDPAAPREEADAG